MAEAWQQLYTSKRWKSIGIKALPPVYAYPASHYVVILMKAANQQRLPKLELCLFGLDMKGGILALAVA